MKIKLLFSVLFFVVSLNLAFAQTKTPKTPEERATGRTNRLEKALKLTAEQKTTVYNANLDAAKQNDELRTKVKAKEVNKAGAMEQKKSIESARDSKISAVLTAEQKPKYEQIKAKQIEKAKARIAKRKATKGKKPSETDQILDELEDDGDL